MKASVYKCDGCGREKQATNHWYIFHVVIESIGIFRWTEDQAKNESAEHFCGTECLFKRLTQWAQ